MSDEFLSHPTKPQPRRWRFWLGALLSLLCLVWLVYTTNWPETWQAMQNANYWLVLSAVGLNLLTIPMRAVRWRLLFSPGNLPAFQTLTSAMLIGQAINIIAPARLGDLVRATLVETERTAFVLGTQVIQTALDLMMTAVLVIILLFQVALPGWWRGSGEALLITAVLALLALAALALARRPAIRLLQALPARWPRLGTQRLLPIGAEFLRSLDAVERPGAMAAAIIWSALIWIVYGLTNYLLLAAIGAPASLLVAFFVLVVLQLGIAVPSSPGRIGVYHYLGIQALAVFAIDGAQAVSFAIILHLISVVLPIIIGALLAWQMGIQVRNAQTISNS